MQSSNLTIFKLNYSGEIKSHDESIGEAIDLFSAVNILAIYVRNQKRLYIWIGKNASQTLKNHIVEFRDNFSNAYPELRVLRYITVESQSEPFDFFESIGISKEVFCEKIEKEETKLRPVIDEINQLKRKIDDLFEKENYEESIDYAKEIIELAKKIDEQALMNDQEEFIALAELKIKSKKLLEDIEAQKNFFIHKIDNIKNDNDILDLHSELENFHNKYNQIIDFSILPEVNEIFLKEDEIWSAFNKRKEEEKKNAEKELEKQKLIEERRKNVDELIKRINELRAQAKRAIEKSDIIEISTIFNKILINLTEYEVKT